MNRRRVLMGGVAVGASIALPRAAVSQEAFPSRPLKLVVPFPPGGPTDVFGRRFAEKARDILGQPVVVENRAGAGGTIGAGSVAKSAPDGYTLLFGTSSTQVTSPLLMASPPYDPLRDFTLMIVGVVPMVLVTRPNLPVQSFAEFLKLVRDNPGKFTFGSAGMGSINHLGGELLKLRAGLNALHVPYKGTNPAQVAVMSGEVDFLLDTFGTALPQHQAGKLKILATMGERRSAVAADVPTMLESGVPDSTCVTVNVVAMPSAVPAPVVEAIAMATRKVMADAALTAALGKLGIEPVADADAARSAKFFAGEIARWAPIVKASGASL